MRQRKIAEITQLTAQQDRETVDGGVAAVEQ